MRRRCFFCARKIEPDYKFPDVLRRFLDTRARLTTRQPHWVRQKVRDPETGKMVNHPDPKRGRWAGGNGLCRGHQRKVAQEVKRARFMALLPYPIGRPGL